jgi:hypothetical protein
LEFIGFKGLKTSICFGGLIQFHLHDWLLAFFYPHQNAGIFLLSKFHPDHSWPEFDKITVRSLNKYLIPLVPHSGVYASFWRIMVFFLRGYLPTWACGVSGVKLSG